MQEGKNTDEMWGYSRDSYRKNRVDSMHISLKNSIFNRFLCINTSKYTYLRNQGIPVYLP